MSYVSKPDMIHFATSCRTGNPILKQSLNISSENPNFVLISATSALPPTLPASLVDFKLSLAILFTNFHFSSNFVMTSLRVCSNKFPFIIKLNVTFAHEIHYPDSIHPSLSLSLAKTFSSRKTHVYNATLSRDIFLVSCKFVQFSFFSDSVILCI